MESFPGKRVVWADGMLLLPQHFIQQEEFLLGVIREQASYLHVERWGVSRLDIAAQELGHGCFRVHAVTGIFPDGTHFDLPGNASVPEPLEITASDEGSVLALALAPDGMEFPMPELAQSLSPVHPPAAAAVVPRYHANEVTSGSYAGESEIAETLQLASLHVRVVRIEDVSARDVVLPIARIRRVDTQGAVELDPLFVPPLLDIRASPRLQAELQGLQALLRHRADWQITRLNQPHTSSLLETSDFLLLQTLLRYEACLRLELSLPRVLPLALFRTLLAFASELGALEHPPRRVSELAKWSPGSPGQSWFALLEQLKSMLASVRERLAMELQLRPTHDGIFVASEALPVMGTHDRIVIAVHAQVPDDWLWHRFAAQTTICASERLVDRIRLQVPGVGLHHLPTTPAELPLQAGWHYFELDRTDVQWAELVSSRSISIHVAGQWPGLVLRGWLLQTSNVLREGT
jgi:type VI secretion system protein ImpJ